MSGLATEMMRCPAEHHATLIHQYLLKFDSSFTTLEVRLPVSNTLSARSLFSTINISCTAYLDLADNALLTGSLTSRVVKELSNLSKY